MQSIALMMFSVTWDKNVSRNASKAGNLLFSIYLLKPFRGCPFHVNFSFGSFASRVKGFVLLRLDTYGSSRMGTPCLVIPAIDRDFL